MTTTNVCTTPLESGDRLSRAEFHRRYCARPDIKRAELVEGVVYVASPVRFTQHGKPHGMIVAWLASYAVRHGGIEFAPDCTVLLDADNELQPDAVLFRTPGSVRVTDDGYIEGAPELVAEVAASSASYDLHDKMNAYRRAGVREYIAWQTLEERIDWFRLEEGQYVRVEPDAAGVIESSVFPGLRLAVSAMLTGDLAAVLAALDAAPEGP